MPGQLWYRLTAIAALTIYSLAKPIGHWSVRENASLSTKCLLEQDTELFNTGDISYTKRIAAADDSCSAGIGADYQLGNVNHNSYVPGGSSIAADGQQIALASYIHPLADPAAWNRIIGYPSNIVSVLIANVLNGPDTTINEAWADVINRASASGKRIIGYVRTGYLGQSQQRFETRLGSTEMADWVAQIEADVDLWYALYPGKIGGIFFDEVLNICGSNNEYADLYRFLSDNTKRKYSDAFTVLNPGTTIPQCFENSADTLMTFEQSFDIYMNSYVPNPGWTPTDPRKLWHIIYGVPQAEAARVANLAHERGAGFIHITDDTLPNPYDTLPNEAYMSALMNAVQGGTPAIASPTPFDNDGRAAFPLNGLRVTDSDYSSVRLKWNISNRSRPYAYAIFRDGREVARLPGTMDRVTIGNISPGSRSSFTVHVIGENCQPEETPPY
ncbi:spherulation-specific family 4 protein [Aspergillus foveolatus]|uniref:spherulation-specific family 4 protein n=1 Tax=Aspergillus foveolatus TaxID=210207 RepID=UPI003CCD1D62